MLAAALARAEEPAFTAKRTERFNATMAAGSTLRIENVSGDIVAKPGRELSAVVTITASARTQEKANELLRGTEVNQHRRDDEYALTTEWPFLLRTPGRPRPRHELRHAESEAGRNAV